MLVSTPLLPPKNLGSTEARTTRGVWNAQCLNSSFSDCLHGHTESLYLQSHSCQSKQPAHGLGSSTPPILSNIVKPCGATQSLSYQAMKSNFGLVLSKQWSFSSRGFPHFVPQPQMQINTNIFMCTYSEMMQTWNLIWSDWQPVHQQAYFYMWPLNQILSVGKLSFKTEFKGCYKRPELPFQLILVFIFTWCVTCSM